MTRDELDIVGDLFGLRFTEGGSNGLVEVYVEDDERYFFKCSFDVFWLKDLASVVATAREHPRVLDSKVVRGN